MKYVVVLDENEKPISGETCDDYVTVMWSSGEGGTNVNVRVLQSDKGNLGHVELACRLLARAMRAGNSPLYAMIGHVIETALDKTIENIQKDQQGKE